MSDADQIDSGVTPSFSQRNNIEPKIPIQIESINGDLRNRIWNIIDGYLRSFLRRSTYGPVWDENFKPFIKKLWDGFLKKPIDSISWDAIDDLKYIKTQFYSYKWNKVYDFLEFLLKSMGTLSQDTLREKLNSVLKEENSAYRILNNQVIPIISELEIKSIEEAILDSPNTTKTHLQKSINLVSDRDKPDYENSSKESVLAIEALAREISGTSSQLSSILSNKDYNFTKLVNPHRTIKEIITKLYAYRGDQGGVAHSLRSTGSRVSKEEAQLVLIMSSAIINFVKSRLPAYQP